MQPASPSSVDPSQVNQSQPQPKQGLNPIRSIGSCCGRSIKKVGLCLENALKTVFQGFQNVTDSAARMKDDPNALGKTIKLTCYGILGFQYLKNRPAFMATFSEKLNTVDSFIDTAQFMGDIDYFLNRHKAGKLNDDIKEGNNHKIIGQVALGTADGIGFFMWLDELKVISLAKWSAQAAARIPGFKYVAQISLNTIVRGLVGIGFAYLGLDALKRLNDPSNAFNKAAKKQARLDLTWSVAEVAFKVFALLGGTAIGGGIGIAGTVFFGTLAAGTGLRSFLHYSYNERAIKEKKFPLLVSTAR